MRSFGIALTLLVSLIACSLLTPTPVPTSAPTSVPTSIPTLVPTSTPTPEPTPESTPDLSGGIKLNDTQEVVDKMKALCCVDGWFDHLYNAEQKNEPTTHNEDELDEVGAAFLESLEAAGQRFDANEFFTVLPHLAPEDGYVLDYVYSYGGIGGAPILYARLEGEPAYEYLSDFKEAGIKHEDYLGHIQVDGTEEAFFELVVLSIMGDQFYLDWHANYNDWEVVSSREQVEEIIAEINKDRDDPPITEAQEEAALQLDLAPSVTFEEDEVLVRVVVFTKWGGFIERVYTIDRDFPHKMSLSHEEILIPYRCGIVF